MASSESNGDVFPWLKSMPVAPEYRPSVAEFQDPIGYIFKIEKEASKYGICKIVPPYPPSSKKTAIANLNRSLAKATFTTRQQQIGFCPRKHRPVQRPVWQSGDTYSFQEFQSKAKSFEKIYLKKHTKKSSGSGLGPLETETLFWKATVDKPFSVEYANDIPGSAFATAKCRDGGDPASLADTAWNMRSVSRANGSLLRFMKEEIPGVTSPMVYLAMLFSWFAWHVEDHDLHSLNYLHMGAGKTWYGVPRDGAVAFEEVVRVHGYGGEINPLVTFATLGEKTTVMSPEVFVSAGVPCCRLVQNAGEFVVTFPRAYHAGFSHGKKLKSKNVAYRLKDPLFKGDGVVILSNAFNVFGEGFNCGEAANIATPEWLRIAKDAAIRRASINYPPMVSHFQLLYDLALALCSRIPGSIRAEPRSSRLKDKKKGEGETVIKELFVQDVLQNNDLLRVLGKGSAVVLLPRSSVDISVCSKLRVGSQKLKVNPGFSINVCNSQGMNSSKGFVSDDLAFNKNHGIKQEKSSYSVKEKFTTLWERNGICSVDANGNKCASSSKLHKRGTEGETSQGDGLSDQRLFACVTCGILSFSCVAIVQPTEPAARYLMSADCMFFNDWVVGSGVSSNKLTVAHEDATIPDPNMYSGWMEKNAEEGLYDDPVQSDQYEPQNADKNYKEALKSEREKGNTALALLVSAYGNSDSEEDQDEPDTAVYGHESTAAINSTSGISPSHFRNSHASRVTGLDKGDDVSLMGANHGDYMHCRSECNLSHQSFDHTLEKQDYDITSVFTFKNMRTVPISTSSCSQDAHDVEKSFPVKARVPVDNKNALLVQQSDEDSSRMHVFCLQHAAEAEQQLQQIGGADILLLCHPDYPKIEAEAKLVAKDLGIDYIWKNIVYRPAAKEDEERIQVALDCEDAIPGNGDWAVKLGINLFYSATLSRSPLYSKQMPSNSVIYHAFGCCSPASSPIEPKVYRRRTNKPKKVVAGKWCGKVWMSNQVHHLLVKRDSGNVEDEKSLHGLILPDEKIERSENTPERETTIRKSGKKKKMTVESGRTRKGKFAEKDDAYDNSTKDKPNPRSRRTLRSKHAGHVDTDGATLEGDSSPPCHRKPVNKQTNCTGSDALSDDSFDDNYHLWHTKDVSVNKAKFVDNDVVSEGTADCDSDWQQIEEHSSKQVEDTERDALSDDILDVSSLQLHRKTSKGKHAKHSEDVISDDQMENHFQKQQRRIPKSRHGKDLAEEDIRISDDQLELNTQKQRRKNPKSRQAKYLTEDNIVSHDQLEGHCRKYQRRTPKGRQAKCVAGEDVMSDDQLQDNFQKQQTTYSRRRQNKGIYKEVKKVMSDDQSEDHFQVQQRRFTRSSRLNKCADEQVLDDLDENNSYLLHRTAKRRKVKCMDEDDVISDDEMENDSCQPDKRTLPSKQSKPKTLQQIKEANSLKKNQTSRPVKCGARKSKASQQIKLASHLRNKEFGNSREFSLHMEEEEEGGPSTRLRKRVPKAEESEGKSEDKQTKRKKVKNAKAAKVSAGHGKMKDVEADYQCDIEGCTMSFGSKRELMHHKRNICPVKGCGKKFFSHKYLVQHRRVHEDDRPLKCPWKGCKMTFKWAWARTEHIRVHTGSRPYACAEPGCGQTFRFVSDFSRHKRKTGHSTKKSR